MAYLTRQNLKDYLKITTTADDTILDLCVAWAQAKIERYTGRVFEASADTTRTFDAVRDVDGGRLVLDYDLAAITTVTNGDGTALTSSQYVTEPRRVGPYYALSLTYGGGQTWQWVTTPEGAISITGRWAYSTTPPDDVKRAAYRLAAYYYRQKDSQVFDTTAVPELGIMTIPTGMPKDVADDLDIYRRRQM